jgi:hypothetical protein
VLTAQRLFMPARATLPLSLKILTGKVSPYIVITHRRHRQLSGSSLVQISLDLTRDISFSNLSVCNCFVLVLSEQTY